MSKNATKPQTKVQDNQNVLTAKQKNVIEVILKPTAGLADYHVERKGLEFSPDVFKTLRKAELVGSHGSLVWVTKKGLAAYTSVAPAPEPAVETPKPKAEAPKPPAPKKEKAAPKEKPATLNWAFRRLRNQAIAYFTSGLKRDKLTENIKQFRGDIMALPESYKALSENIMRIIEDDNKLCVGDWDSFMESFFATVIHPGSRSVK